MSSSEATPPPDLHRVERGEAGRVLRELRAQDFFFTVLQTERVNETYQRIRFRGNGFLARYEPYPTMWVRLWFSDPSGSGAGHQRAYTLVDPDVATDTFWLEFAIHDGAAARWALAAQPGQHIEASLYGSEPSLPSHQDVDVHLLVGDTASLPAVNSLLDALGPAPAVVLLEWVHDVDRALPVRARGQDRVRWIERQNAGRDLLAACSEEIETLRDECGTPGTGEQACSRVFAWGACDTVTTRALTKQLRAGGLPRDYVKTLGYWLPPVTDDEALTG